MKYPKEYLNEIKLRLKVSQVVSKSVQLKKRGKEFIGLSPFNNEKSPSFTVSDEKEFYHCFSTGEHGNIFDFVMKIKSLGFGEAVRLLAAEAGMQPYKFSNFDEKKEKKFQIYKNILRDYNSNFHQELFNVSNKEALEYLRKRGLKKEIIKEYRLGYVPWQNDYYKTLLKKYSEDEINSTGLYYKNDRTGNFIDRFNSRIIFPVNNLTGDTIAFGGRIIKESKLAKYINSPETDFYKKGKMIFNLDKAKSLRSDTDDVIIVEGYMDVVSLSSAGIKNVISNSGTALTESQIDLIWKFFNNPIVCLDGDQSGQNAALRIAEKLFSLINENNKIFFSILPKGEDPDDYIKKNGKENFLELLKKKKIIQNYIWDSYIEEVDQNNPFEISKFEKNIKNLSYTIKDETLKKYILEDYLQKIKDLTPFQNYKKRFNSNYYKKPHYKILNETREIHKKKNNYSKQTLTEFSLLFLMTHYPSIAQKKIEEISNCIFSSVDIEKLRKRIISLFTEKISSEMLLKKLEPDFSKVIQEIINNANVKIIANKKDENEICEIYEDLFEDLKKIKHQKKIDSFESQLLNNFDENSYSELIKLKSQINSD